MGLDAMILVFLMLSFKPALSHSTFIFIQRLFSSSSLSAVRMATSAHLRLSIFLLAIFIPACDSSSPAFCMIHLACVFAKSLQSSPTLCDPMDCSLPGSSAHGILQARVLEWLATRSSRGSSWPRDQTCGSCSSCIAADSSPLSHQGSPFKEKKWQHLLLMIKFKCSSKN